MDEKNARLEERIAISKLLTASIAQLMLICASLLVFFAYLDLPPLISAAGALILTFALSFFCWHGKSAARAVLLASLLASQIVMLKYFESLLLLFALIDGAVLVAILHSIRSEKELAENPDSQAG